MRGRAHPGEGAQVEQSYLQQTALTGYGKFEDPWDGCLGRPLEGAGSPRQRKKHINLALGIHMT